jgi:hypothetical protein
MLWKCKSTFSVEISEDVVEIENKAFSNCHCLRNVAIPPNAIIGDYILDEATDLLQLFGNSIARIIRQLKHRFDRLPVHSSFYFQSYHQGALQRLIDAINTKEIGSTSAKSKTAR